MDRKTKKCKDIDLQSTKSKSRSLILERPRHAEAVTERKRKTLWIPPISSFKNRYHPILQTFYAKLREWHFLLNVQTGDMSNTINPALSEHFRIDIDFLRPNEVVDYVFMRLYIVKADIENPFPNVIVDVHYNDSILVDKCWTNVKWILGKLFAYPD